MLKKTSVSLDVRIPAGLLVSPGEVAVSFWGSLIHRHLNLSSPFLPQGGGGHHSITHCKDHPPTQRCLGVWVWSIRGWAPKCTETAWSEGLGRWNISCLCWRVKLAHLPRFQMVSLAVKNDPHCPLQLQARREGAVCPPFRRSRVSRGQPTTGRRDCLPEKEGAAHSVPP